MFSPFGNQIANTSAAWHPEPQGRGTFSVLYSCLTTMILCVWTSVHLNVPGHNGGLKQSLLRKPGWLLLALLAPEVVAWNAWEQRRVAQELMNDFIEAFEPGLPTRLGWVQRLRNAINSDSKSSEEPSVDLEQDCMFNGRSKIALVHGLYAAMGGYVIQTHLMDGKYPITNQGRLTLTKHGVQWLLLHAKAVFPDLTEAEILDKSKASTLVKTLTCLQALWFCLQCIVRLTMNTSISLLKLNVFGHCICTFIIYAIWWNKPMDISEPTIIEIKDEPEYEGLVALLCSFTSRTVPRLPHPLDEIVEIGYRYIRRTDPSKSRASRRARNLNKDPNCYRWEGKYRCDFDTKFHTTLDTTHSFVSDKEAYDEWIGLGFDVDTNERELAECARLQIEQLRQLFDLDDSHPHIKVSMYEHSRRSTFRITVGTEHIGLTYHLSREKLDWLRIESLTSGQKSTKPSSQESDKKSSDYRLERSYLTWLDKAGRGPEFFLDSSGDRPDRPLGDRIHDWTFRVNARLQKRPRLWFFNAERAWYNLIQVYVAWGLWGMADRLFGGLAMSAAALVYGGLHLLAWNAPFHAPIYGLLWKVSGIVTASLGAFPFILLLFVFSLCGLGWSENYSMLLWLMVIVTMLTLLGTILFPVAYLLARVYLVVESFLSLAYLPESVLVTPNFSLYFPHIG